MLARYIIVFFFCVGNIFCKILVNQIFYINFTPSIFSDMMHHPCIFEINVIVGCSVLQRLIRSRFIVIVVQIFCFLIDLFLGVSLVALHVTEKYPTIFVDSSVFSFLLAVFTLYILRVY